MGQPVFIRCPLDPRYNVGAIPQTYAEEAFLRLVDALDMNDIIPVIREGLHQIENDPEDHKDRKAEDKTTGCRRKIEESVKEANEKQLVCLETDQPGREDQVKDRYGSR